MQACAPTVTDAVAGLGRSARMPRHDSSVPLPYPALARVINASPMAASVAAS